MSEAKFKHLAMWTWPDAVLGEAPERIAERLVAAHIDIVIPYFSGGEDQAGRAEYQARLQRLTEEAHRRGLQVIACFDEMRVYAAMSAKHLAQVRQNGAAGGILCPANPAARDFILGELDHALTDFAFDGINLEDSYVYNSTTIYDVAHAGRGAAYKIVPVCYCEYCRAHAPIEKPDWHQWKTDRMSELIAAEAKLIRDRRPGLPFSVAARMPYARDEFYAPYAKEIPYYEGWQYCQARDGFAADWLAWLQRGYLQYVCPMSYFHTPRLVELHTLECQKLIPTANRDVWIGLGLDTITAEYGQGLRDIPDPAETKQEIYRNDAASLGKLLDLQARLGQENVVFFSHAFLKDEHLPLIARYR